MSFLKLSDVSKKFKVGSITVEALKDVSFELEDGEFAVVLCSSGFSAEWTPRRKEK